MNNKINIVLFGIGNVGSALINKVLKNRKALVLDKQIDFRFPVITNSSVAFFAKEGTNFSWEANFIQFGVPFKLEDIMTYIKSNKLENVIAIDATNDGEFAKEYFDLLQNELNVVSVNQLVTQFPVDFNRELNLAASIFGLDYKFIKLNKADKHLVAEKLFETVVKIAQKQKELTI